MRITHLGHSCLLVETGGHRLLLDPGSFTPGFEDLDGLDAVAHHPPARRPRRSRAAARPRRPQPGRTPARRVLPIAAELTTLGLSAAGARAGRAVHEIGGARRRGRRRRARPDPSRHPPGRATWGCCSARTVTRRSSTPATAMTVPEGVDILGLPLTAPWTSIRETVAFARAVGAPKAVPIHDGGASLGGRAVYLRLVGALVEGVRLRDLAGAGAVDW